MTKRALPPCSVPNCDHAAGAVIKGELYCGAHAVRELQSLRGTGDPTKRQQISG